ncbi:MAG: hypothetical protein KatS3mg028_1290 [Bacteroidia bacterium]|nr:MAG: hypothetical protein KatS3mg028_1290 [Bacteroidia bacterium]
MNILITCGGGFQGLTLIKDIKQSKETHFVVVTDINTDSITHYFAEEYIISPPVSQEEKYIQFLHDLVDKYKLNFIIPATGIDIELLSTLKTDFLKKNCSIFVPDIDALSIFLNKKKSIEFLSNNNFPVLPTYKLTDIESNLTDCLPFIIKPIIGSGSKGITKIKTIYEWNMFKKNKSDIDNNYVIQPLIDDFDEYSIDFNISLSGKMSYPIIRKRNFTTLGFAAVMEFSQKYYIFLKDVILKIQEVFSDSIFSGYYNIQVIYAKNKKELWINDINPRIGTSSVLSKFLNVSLFDNVYESPNSKNTYIWDSENAYEFDNFKIIRYLHEFKITGNKTRIQNVVLDLDNTLIDTSQFIFDRCKILYDKLQKYISVPKNEFLAFCIHNIINNKIDVLIDNLSIKLKIDKSELLNIYRNILPPVTIYNDAKDLLNYLKFKK